VPGRHAVGLTGTCCPPLEGSPICDEATLTFAGRQAGSADRAATNPARPESLLTFYTPEYRVGGRSLARFMAASTLTSPTVRTTIGAGPVEVVDSLRELGSFGASPREEGGLIVSRSRLGSRWHKEAL